MSRFLQENGAKVITVGTEGYNKNALRAVSSAPSDDFSFTVENFGGIDRIKDLLEDKSCESKYSFEHHWDLHSSIGWRAVGDQCRWSLSPILWL